MATQSGKLMVTAVIAALAGSFAVTHLAGGTHTALPHVFYIPVVMAAARFRHFGALATAVAAGVLCGPLMPLDVNTGAPQDVSGWAIRLAFFVLTGQVVALLCHRSVESLAQGVADRRVRADLERALVRGEFRVVYQALVDLKSGVTLGFEALLRWDHPKRGSVPPMDFIAAAERTGVIIPIGTFVLREAASQLTKWRQQASGAHLKMAVNLSARQLEDDGLPAEVAAVFEETGLPAGALQLEVTETALISDGDAAKRRLTALRLLGVTIAIDDFGTGQSSLSYLHRFQANVIKIDRSFVSALEHDPYARAVAQAVVTIAHSMDATTVAEGIETQAQADIMRRLGCDVGQGFHYGKPSPAATAVRRTLTLPDLSDIS